MDLIPYSTMRNIDNIRREINKIYGFPFTFFEEDISSRLRGPLTDVYETEKEIIISCDLPGLQRKEDVTINIDNKVVTISGTLNREKHTVQDDRMHRQERFSGQFHRSVSLPMNVSSDNVKAIYQNGVLNIFLTKVSDKEKKSVDIEFRH